MRFIEVSHRIEAGMKTYPGLPVPTVDVVVDYEASRERYAGKAEFLIASLHLCGNTGTYVDSPHHRYPGGVDLADLPLERLADLPVVVVDASRGGRAIEPELFGGSELAGRAVLLRTDFSRHWGPRRTSRGTRSSQMRAPSCSYGRSRRLSVSTRLTSTTSPICPGPRTRSCSAKGSRSANT